METLGELSKSFEEKYNALVQINVSLSAALPTVRSQLRDFYYELTTAGINLDELQISEKGKAQFYFEDSVVSQSHGETIRIIGLKHAIGEALNAQSIDALDAAVQELGLECHDCYLDDSGRELNMGGNSSNAPSGPNETHPWRYYVIPQSDAKKYAERPQRFYEKLSYSLSLLRAILCMQSLIKQQVSLLSADKNEIDELEQYLKSLPIFPDALDIGQITSQAKKIARLSKKVEHCQVSMLEKLGSLKQDSTSNPMSTMAGFLFSMMTFSLLREQNAAKSFGSKTVLGMAGIAFQRMVTAGQTGSSHYQELSTKLCNVLNLTSTGILQIKTILTGIFCEAQASDSSDLSEAQSLDISGLSEAKSSDSSKLISYLRQKYLKNLFAGISGRLSTETSLIKTQLIERGFTTDEIGEIFSLPQIGFYGAYARFLVWHEPPNHPVDRSPPLGGVYAGYVVSPTTATEADSAPTPEIP